MEGSLDMEEEWMGLAVGGGVERREQGEMRGREKCGQVVKQLKKF